MHTTTRSIVRFMAATAAMAAPVLALFMAFYLIADPFNALRQPSTLFPAASGGSPTVGANKGAITISNFNKQLATGKTYNSFIFGSSISCCYDAREWAGLLDDADSASPYHFDSSGESIESMAAKVAFRPPRHPDAPRPHCPRPGGSTKPTRQQSVQHRPSAAASGPLHWIRFHYTFFRAATNADFLKSYIPGLMLDSAVNNGRNPIFEVQPISYDPETNQETLPLWDSLIASQPEQFYSSHPLPPPATAPSEAPQAIDGPRLELLKQIAATFKTHGTDCKVIISPNRQKKFLNRADLKALGNLFGASQVHDFSLSESRLTETDSLFYDPIHYRPQLASHLLRLTYGANTVSK